MSHRPLTRYKAKYLLIGALFTLLLSATYSFGTKYQNDERELKKIRQEQAMSTELRKVQAFYLHKNPRLWDTLAAEMASATVEAARAYKIPLEIQVGVNTCESEAHPFAESPSGAKGMGQVDFRAWAEELGAGNPFEPRYNQFGTSFVLSTYTRRYGFRKGLEIYNLGEGNYRRGRRAKRYVARVFEAASEYRYFVAEVR